MDAGATLIRKGPGVPLCPEEDACHDPHRRGPAARARFSGRGRITGRLASQGAGHPRPRPPIQLWVLALTAGLIAGFASWLIGEKYGRFDPPARAGSGSLSRPGMSVLHHREQQAAQTLEATYAFGALAAVLGLALGLAGGSARRSTRAAVIAAIVGSILGGAAAGAVTRLAVPIYFWILNPNTNDLVVGILSQGVISSIMGAAGGVAFGIGFGDRRCAVRALLGGLIGAIAGCSSMR
jgi:hypothetical protein